MMDLVSIVDTMLVSVDTPNTRCGSVYHDFLILSIGSLVVCYGTPGFGWYALVWHEPRYELSTRAPKSHIHSHRWINVAMFWCSLSPFLPLN